MSEIEYLKQKLVAGEWHPIVAKYKFHYCKEN